MIPVNKAEAKAIREKFPDAHVVRTCKQKSKRSRYYAEERSPILKLLAKMRGQVTSVQADKFDGYNVNDG